MIPEQNEGVTRITIDIPATLTDAATQRGFGDLTISIHEVTRRFLEYATGRHVHGLTTPTTGAVDVGAPFRTLN